MNRPVFFLWLLYHLWVQRAMFIKFLSAGGETMHVIVT